MAFSNRIGSALKQALSRHIIPDMSLSNSSMYQAYRSMSSSKLFVGGLSYGTDETSLKEVFQQYGDLVDVRIIMDRESGRSRGFGFVSFTSTDNATTAMQNLDGQDLHGRRIKVNYATEKPRGGFGGGGYGGGDGYSSGGNYNSGYSSSGNYNSGYSSGGNYNSGYPGTGSNYNSGYVGGGDYNSGSGGQGGYASGGGNYTSEGGGYGGHVSSGDQNSNYATTPNIGNYGVSGGNFSSGFEGTGGGYDGGQQHMSIKPEGAEIVNDDSNSLDGNYRDDDDEADGFANTRS